MYLRHSTVRRGGKSHTYWRLVKSVRVGRKVRQQTVACLGELDSEGRLAARALAESLVGIERQPGLFEDDVPAEPIAVDLRKLSLERGRRFGDVWLAWKLWQAVGLDSLLEDLIPEGRADVSWSVMAAVLVIARLCEPSSELHIAEDWFRRTALDDLLGVAEAKVNDDRLYRALDKLLERKDALERHIKDRLGTLFGLDYDLLLYDVTSTYFEGQANRNPQAARGYSRDHRPDCKQVCIGLVVTREGYPLGFEVFEGNRHDSKTLQTIVERMEQRYGKSSRIWALDRGMVSEANLTWLKERGSRYIVGTPKAQLKAFQRKLTAKAWTTIRDGLEVKLCPPADGGDVYIVCKSADRALKERAMRERFEKRIEAGLEKIAAACAKRKCQVGVIERRIGRLMGQNSRAAALFTVTVKPDKHNAAQLRWKKRKPALAGCERRDGCYLLRSNVTDWQPEELWQAYMQLTEAEAAFRIQKDLLELRPVWHQKKDRVQAHILVCFLAYVLRKTLEGWCKRAGLGASVTTLLEEMTRIQSTDVVLPTRDGRTVRIRCIVQPDQAQAILIDRLGLELPKRLRIPKGIDRM